jgi:hypothetical protein
MWASAPAALTLVKEHQHAARDLDEIGDEHDAALRHRVGEGPDESREQHVGDGEEELEQRRHPFGRCICMSSAIAATSSALSASDEKNCAAMMM